MLCPHSDLAQVVMLVATFATVVQSSIIRRSTIDNPCHSSLTSTTTGTFQDLDGQISDTIMAARTANATCEALKTALVQGNYLTASEISDLRSINITGLTAEYTDVNMNQANKITHLKQDYMVISKHLLYIENATSIAHILVENVQNSLASVRHSVAILLCKVDTALRSQGGSSTDRPTPSMAQMEFDADTKGCSQYLYTLAKTTQKFLRYVTEKYEQFANTNKG